MDGMEELEFFSDSNNPVQIDNKSLVESAMIMTKLQPGSFSGIKYRHVGKSGLKISNIGLGE